METTTAFDTDSLISRHSLAHQAFKPGQSIIGQGLHPQGIYILLEGRILAKTEDPQLQRETILNFQFKQGDILCAKELFSQQAMAYALVCETNVSVCFIEHEKVQSLMAQESQLYPALVQSMARQFASLQQFHINDALNASPIPEVDFILDNARKAYGQIQNLDESLIDEVIQTVANEVADQAQHFAKLTVLESAMGVAENKVDKIKLGTLAVAQDLVGKPGVGAVFSDENSVQTIGQSMGVVFAMIPVTNPVETLVFKFLIALKSRNAIIMSSHRKAQNVGVQAVNIIQNVLKRFKLPVDLVQTPQMPPNRALTNGFMKSKKVDFILATGGPSMVHSAYMSGTPAIGVGKGNAPVWITHDADVARAAQLVVASKSFDNGIVCGSENNLLVDASVYQAFIDQAVEQGAALFTQGEMELLMDQLFAHGSLGADYVGQSAADICEQLGVRRDYPIKLILAEVDKASDPSPLFKEKLAPVLSLSKMQNAGQAKELARTILQGEGAGHTAIIHCGDLAQARDYAQYVDVSRLLVNNAGTQGCIGADNGLQLSWTLGCGTQGGGATSDNVSYKHLMNMKRIAYATA